MRSAREKRANQKSFGCVFILGQGALICLLLVANGFFVRSTLNLEWGDEMRISQAVNLLLPMVMIFVELWIFDIIFASKTRHKT